MTSLVPPLPHYSIPTFKCQVLGNLVSSGKNLHTSFLRWLKREVAREEELWADATSYSQEGREAFEGSSDIANVT